MVSKHTTKHTSRHVSKHRMTAENLECGDAKDEVEEKTEHGDLCKHIYKRKTAPTMRSASKNGAEHDDLETGLRTVDDALHDKSHPRRPLH